MAAPATTKATRTLIEFCTSEDSELGAKSNFDRAGCNVTRLTIDNDLSTPEGLEFALAQVDKAALQGHSIDLWGSLPCTAGTSWWYINLAQYASAEALLAAHTDTFKRLLGNFSMVAQYVICLGGRVHFEWPAGCTLWKHELVTSMLVEL